MPKRGWKSVTLPEELKERLQKEAKPGESIAELIRRKLDEPYTRQLFLKDLAAIFKDVSPEELKQIAKLLAKGD